MKPGPKKGPADHLGPHQFKPGQTGNPHGRPPLSPVQRELRKLTLSRYREVIEVALSGNLQALKDMIADPDTPAIQVGVASAILHAIKKGDASVLELFAARIVGKIPDVLKLDGGINLTANDRVGKLSDQEINARLKRLESDI